MTDQIFWNQADVSSAGTSFAAITGNYPGREMRVDGEVVSASLVTSADVGAAGQNYEVELYVNRWDGAAYVGFVTTGVNLKLTGASGTQKAVDDNNIGVLFSARDMFQWYEKRTGAPNSVSANITMAVEYTQRG